MAYTKFAESEPYDAASGKRLNQFGDELQQQINDCLKKVIIMPSGTHVNECSETGIYRCVQWEGSPQGAPDGQGTLIVINYSGDISYGWVQQEFLTAHSVDRWVHSYTAGTDSGWKQIITTSQWQAKSANMANGWVTWGGIYYPTFVKNGNLVTVCGGSIGGGTTTGGTNLLIDIPTEYRPTTLRIASLKHNSGSTGLITIQASGSLQIDTSWGNTWLSTGLYDLNFSYRI